MRNEGYSGGGAQEDSDTCRHAGMSSVAVKNSNWNYVLAVLPLTDWCNAIINGAAT